MATELQVANMAWTPKFKDLIDFILANRTDKVFKGYDECQIAGMLLEALEDNCLYYATDNNRITGMILAKLSGPSKTVWVEENLAMNMSNLRAFAKKAREQFVGYDFQGFKRGKSRDYNKFINKG